MCNYLLELNKPPLLLANREQSLATSQPEYRRPDPARITWCPKWSKTHHYTPETAHVIKWL